MIYFLDWISFLDNLLAYLVSHNDYPCLTHMRDKLYLVLFFYSIGGITAGILLIYYCPYFSVKIEPRSTGTYIKVYTLCMGYRGYMAIKIMHLHIIMCKIWIYFRVEHLAVQYLVIIQLEPL